MIRTIRDWFPITWTGASLLAVCTLAAIFGASAHQDLLLSAAAPAAAAVVLLEALLTTAAAIAVRLLIRRNRGIQKVQMEAGAANPTGFFVPFPVWMPGVGISCSWAHSSEVELVPRGRRLAEVCTPLARGRLDKIERTLSFHGKIGLARVEWRMAEPADVEILPASAVLENQVAFLGPAQGDDTADVSGPPSGDRIDMRAYVPGDPPRFLLWKVFARTRKLMVRTPEPAYSPAQRFCIWFAPSADDEAAARLGRQIVEKGMAGEHWRFAAEGIREEASERHAALDLLMRSGKARRPEAAGDLDSFTSRARAAGYTACLILTAPSRAMEFAGLADDRRMALPCHVLAAADRAVAAPHTSRLSRLWRAPVQTEPPGVLLPERWPGNGPVWLYEACTGKILPPEEFGRVYA